MQKVQTLIPADLWFRTALIILIFSAVTVWLLLYHPEAFSDRETLKFWSVGLAGFIGVTLFDLYLRRGYKIAYDDDAIYWRKVGISRNPAKIISMPFSAITEISSDPGSLGIRPFEAAILHAEGSDIPDIILSRLYLREGDIRYILLKASQSTRVVLDEEVRAFL